MSGEATGRPHLGRLKNHSSPNSIKICDLDEMVPSDGEGEDHTCKSLERRQALLCLAGWTAAGCISAEASESQEAVETDSTMEMTDFVYINFGLCEKGLKANRTLGDTSILCDSPLPLGRVVLGLYGNAAPGTVQTFKKLCVSGSFHQTALSKILPGEYIIAGQQGPHRAGMVEVPDSIGPNPDILSASAFNLKHSKPGTVSLNLSENQDDDYVRGRKNYREVSFLITTGPGPVPRLDDENIVFGRVVEGIDVIGKISEVPTFKANKSLRVFSDLAQVIGDDRASSTRAKYGKPLQPVVITETGVL